MVSFTKSSTFEFRERMVDQQPRLDMSPFWWQVWSQLAKEDDTTKTLLIGSKLTSEIRWTIEQERQKNSSRFMLAKSCNLCKSLLWWCLTGHPCSLQMLQFFVAGISSLKIKKQGAYEYFSTWSPLFTLLFVNLLLVFVTPFWCWFNLFTLCGVLEWVCFWTPFKSFIPWHTAIALCLL